MINMRIRANNLTVLNWNADGLAQKELEFKEFIREHQVDVALVTETHLKPAIAIRVPGYAIYRSDRLTGAKGGTAVIIKRSIDHQPIELPPPNTLETTGIQVTTRRGKLRLIAAYRPPTRAFDIADVENIFRTNESTLLAGDLNAKHQNWNCRTNNAAGNKLQRFADRNNVIIDGPVDPTHTPHNGAVRSVLDIVVAKNLPWDHTMLTVNDMSSDHDPVLIELTGEFEKHVPVKHTIAWPAFQEHLKQNYGKITRIDNIRELQERVVHITDKITRAYDFAKNPRPTRELRPRLPAELYNLIREKNRARRRHHRTLAPEDRRAKNALQEKVKVALAENRNENWARKLEAIEHGADIWRLKRALGRSKRAPVPPIHGANGMNFADGEKAEAFADSLEAQCTPVFDNANLDFVGNVEKTVRRSLARPPTDAIPCTSPGEVEEIIRQLRRRKAPGPDKITNEMLQNAPKKIAAALANIFNAALRLRYFPPAWKRATVVMILKPKENPAFPQNYRPISLLPTMGKILETIIKNRLQKIVDDLNIVPAEQYGFRAGHSTTDQVVRLTTNAVYSFNIKQHTGALFFDISKAFDKVWHGGLLWKMLQANIPKSTVAMISSYLRHRTFRVQINGHSSEERSAEAGVPQGSVLAPLLFTIFTRDTPRTARTQLYLYADDTALTTRAKQPAIIHKNLQNAASELERWFSRWRFKVNPAKSRAIILTRKRLPEMETVKIFGEDIPWVKQVKYLGVTMDTRLTWKHHVTEKLAAAQRALCSIYALINRSSRLNLKIKKNLYIMALRPIVTYAAPVWAQASRTQKQRIQRYQNKTLRMITNAPWFVRNANIHADLEIPLIDEYLTQLTEEYRDRVANHVNENVAELIEQGLPGRHMRPLDTL